MTDPDLKELNAELNFVYRYLRKLGIKHEDSQDAVQETAYRFLLYYDSIKTSKIRSWLVRVALNFYFDQYRKNKRIQFDLLDDKITLLSEDLPEDILLSKENWSDIERVLNELKPQYKELIVFKYVWNLKYEEISSILDMKIGTVKTSLYRARIQFGKIYRRFYDE
ncbi:RNA polymerase sigma factor [Bacillus nitroreducens]